MTDSLPPATDKSHKILADIDGFVVDAMCNSQIPGCQFAVSKDGKLVYSRGFGFACREKKTAVEPRHLFRIASVSKSLTAVGVMKLVESGSVCHRLLETAQIWRSLRGAQSCICEAHPLAMRASLI